ncbi:spore protease YyaC [Paenibacillus sp. GCM10027626]|uniref:spore protease YyaC n=1 Tax=Paenibacillus sp. GCM10027626 TaxID=3273411 RepID=UPI0036288683
MKLARTKDSPLNVAHTEPNVMGILINELTDLLHNAPHDARIVIVCVGTDRSTGDALGPLVGSGLSKYRSLFFDLYGTLEQPVHALNLNDTLQQIEKKTPNPFIIGIDACLGQVSSVGNIQVGTGPVRPGAGVNKELPPVGNMHITGIVNVGGFMEYFVLQNTRLHLVMHMADVIACSLFSAVVQTVRSRSMNPPAVMQD